MNMKKLIIIYTLILFGCSSNSNTQTDQTRDIEPDLEKVSIEKIQKQKVQKKRTEETEKLGSQATGLFKNSPFIDSLILEGFQKDFLDELVKNGDGEFETDSTYVIDSVKRYDVEFGYRVFYIRGQFIPSTATFHYYGVYDENKIQHQIYHLPIETFVTLTKYQCTPTYMSLFGIITDENSYESEEDLLFGLYR